LVAKTKAEKVPLIAMVVAAYTNDILKLGFRALGLESNGNYAIDISQGITTPTPANIPWSHGLLMSVVWALIAAGIAYLVYRDRRTAAIVGGVVLSHWFLDFIVHPPELPLLFAGSPMVGLGLWTTRWGLQVSAVIEIVMLALGLTLYFIHRNKMTKTSNLQPK
jgi:hypothetical protein